MNEKPMEALPEYVYQGIPTNRLAAAIASLQHAETAARIKDKLAYLRRANESIMYARRSAQSVAASWREYNRRARELGAFIHEDEVVTLDSAALAQRNLGGPTSSPHDLDRDKLATDLGGHSQHFGSNDSDTWAYCRCNPDVVLLSFGRPGTPMGDQDRDWYLQAIRLFNQHLADVVRDRVAEEMDRWAAFWGSLPCDDDDDCGDLDCKAFRRCASDATIRAGEMRGNYLEAAPIAYEILDGGVERR